RPCVDSGEALEERRLALHDGKGRLRPDVAEPEHRRPVGDDGDGVALDRQPSRVLRVPGDGHADPADTWGVGHREVLASAGLTLGSTLILPPRWSRNTRSETLWTRTPSRVSTASTSSFAWSPSDADAVRSMTRESGWESTTS